MNPKPRVLCVDDEPQVLEGLRLQLRQRYDVGVAESGAAGLAFLESTRDVAVVLSDMRMPEMDGAAFLSRARSIAPDAVRMLLTGYADTQSAISAVNLGQIFRFISKPCPPDELRAAFDAATTQHNLIVAEKVLLQRTLLGCVDACCKVLALVNPIAFCRASRLKAKAHVIVRALQLEDQWQIEAAAALSQLGCVTLNEETMMRVFEGDELDEADRVALASSIGTSIKLIEEIPRLEPVTEILSYLRNTTNGGSVAAPAKVSIGGRLLRTLMDLDSLETQGLTRAAAFDKLRGAPDAYDAELLERVASVMSAHERLYKTRSTVPLAGLRSGMVLAEDLKKRDGVVIVPRGFEISEALLDHIRAFQGAIAVDLVNVTMK
jgi:CheY-like chemotaxis protein